MSDPATASFEVDGLSGRYLRSHVLGFQHVEGRVSASRHVDGPRSNSPWPSSPAI